MATILVVDDRPLNREFLAMLLRYVGHRVLEAADGAQALKCAREERPALVIADVIMPVMGGVELANRLLSDKISSPIPVIFYTATYRSTEAWELAKSCGVTTVLAKPSEPQVILEAVSAALGIESSKASITPAVDDMLELPGVKQLGTQRVIELQQHLQKTLSKYKLAEGATLSSGMLQRLNHFHSTLQALSLRLAALLELNLALLNEEEPDSLLKLFCHAARDIMNARYAVVCMKSKNLPEQVSAASGLTEEEAQSVFSALDPNADLLQEVLAQGKPRLGCHIPRALGLPALQAPDQAFLLVPVSGGNISYGGLLFSGKLGAYDFNEDDEQFAVTLAAQLVSVFENLALCTRLQHREAQLRESEERFRQLAENIDTVFWMASSDGAEVLYISPAYETVWGRSSQHLYHHPEARFEAIHPEDRQRIEAAWVRFKAEEKFHGEYRILKPDGTLRWIESRGFPVRDATGQIYRIAGIDADITARKTAEAQLEYQANYDLLTHLANRRLLQDRLQHAIDYAQRYSSSVGVLFVDLDRFKLVNDSLGHTMGDRLLAQVAERLKRCVRESDTVARLGGDEFVIVLENLRLPERANQVAQKVLDIVKTPYTLEGQNFFISVSVGISVFPRDGREGETLLKNANTAMHQAKDQGRDRVMFYSPELNALALRHLALQGDLRQALVNQELELYYQPQVNLKKGSVTGVEALLRWRHPELGLISPAEFIPLAEESGLIVPIGEWVLRTACAQAKAWQEAGWPTLTVGVNLSARQFLEARLTQIIARILRETGLAAPSLELEITESLLMQDVESAVTTLNILRGQGVRLAIDDFGTGYSSLSYLKQFPLHRLKIDKSFVRDVTIDGGDTAIAMAIIALAHNLQLQVIAEGVETEAHLTFLKAKMCDEAQGYYFSRPLSSGKIVPWLEKRRRSTRQ